MHGQLVLGHQYRTSCIIISCFKHVSNNFQFLFVWAAVLSVLSRQLNLNICHAYSLPFFLFPIIVTPTPPVRFFCDCKIHFHCTTGGLSFAIRSTASCGGSFSLKQKEWTAPGWKTGRRFRSGKFLVPVSGSLPVTARNGLVFPSNWRIRGKRSDLHWLIWIQNKKRRIVSELCGF